MPVQRLPVSLSVSNQIFHRARHARSGDLLGVLEIQGQRCRFHENGSPTDIDNAVPVYLQRHDDVASACFLVVETGTRGVLELKAYRRDAHGLRPVTLDTGSG